jgi:hypothetical protein
MGGMGGRRKGRKEEGKGQSYQRLVRLSGPGRRAVEDIVHHVFDSAQTDKIPFLFSTNHSFTHSLIH